MAILCTGLSSQHFGHNNTDENDLATDEQFATIEAQRLALYEYGKKAITLEIDRDRHIRGVVATDTKYLKRFFKAFPRDFETFFKIYNYSYNYCDDFDDDAFYQHAHNPWGTFVPHEQKRPFTPDPDKKRLYYEAMSMTLLDIFPALQEVIPAAIYYKKMISVGIGGFWDADEINYFQMHLTGLIFQNTPLAVNILQRKTDKEIAGLFYFLYDGPHPDHEFNQENYAELYAELQKLSPRVAKLMKIAYDRLLSEEHCPGH